MLLFLDIGETHNNGFKAISHATRNANKLPVILSLILLKSKNMFVLEKQSRTTTLQNNTFVAIYK